MQLKMKAYSIAELNETELLDDEGEASGEFGEHGVAECPVGLWGYLLLCILNRHSQLE